MKDFSIKWILVLTMVFSMLVSCGSNDELVEKTNELPEIENEIVKLKELFESKNFNSVNDAASFAKELVQNISPITRAINEDDYIESISPEAMVVIEKMKKLR